MPSLHTHVIAEITDWSSPGGTEVIDDTTPQLGGDLDLNGNDITGTGNINITGSLTISTDLTVVNGGTGASVLTGLLAGNGTSPITGNATVDNTNWLGTDLSVVNGGTGASNTTAARDNLGVEIGVDILAFDQQLQDIGALTPTDNRFMVANGTTWTAETAANARTSMGLSGMATMSPSGVTITGGDITGLDDFAVGLSSFRADNVSYKSIQWFEGALLFNDNVSTTPYIAISNNAYFKSDGTWTRISTDEAEMYDLRDGRHRWYTSPSAAGGGSIAWDEIMRLDSTATLHVDGDVVAFSTSI